MRCKQTYWWNWFFMTNYFNNNYFSPIMLQRKYWVLRTILLSCCIERWLYWVLYARLVCPLTVIKAVFSSELYMTRYFYIYVLTQTKNVFQIYIPNWYLNITNVQIGVNTGNVSYVLMWSFIIVLILLSNDISHSFTSL